MTAHPYLKAFLAGAFVPTLILPLMLAGFIVLRLILHIPIPIERALVFPMALVPCLWALWNMLWLATHTRTHLPIGAHGALLPLVLLPAGATAASCLHVVSLGASGATCFHAVEAPYALIAFVFACVLGAYFLLWKYVVGFVNRVLGIA